MTANEHWRAGFEIEVILGDLDEPSFAKGLSAFGPMDKASPAFCRSLASKLRVETGRLWSAPIRPPSKPGFYVVAEYGLDPLNWPDDRVAGVELLTPPLPFEEADVVRGEIIEAIDVIDGVYNFTGDESTNDCGWHINIDAGDRHRLDPSRFITGVDELLLLARNDRLFTPYTGLQRHAVGTGLLRHLAHDPDGRLLAGSALDNLLKQRAGYDKGYAANFAKTLNGYLELRHFSADAFFNGPSLADQLERIPAAFELGHNRSAPFQKAFLRKFTILSSWLAGIRDKLSWSVSPGLICAAGEVRFEGQPIGRLSADGLVEISLYGRGQHDALAEIRNVGLADIAEGVALLALDLAELRNLGVTSRISGDKAFQRSIVQLANRLRREPELSSDAQQLALAAVRDSPPWKISQ